MNIFAATNLIIAILSIILGTLALLKNYKNPVNLNWALTTFVTAIWSLAFFGVTISTNYYSANLWQYFLDLSSIWAPIFYLRFVLALGRVEKKYKLIYSGSLMLAVIMDIFMLSSSYRHGMQPVFTFRYWVKPAELYFLTPFIYGLLVFVAFWFLIGFIKKNKGSLRLQMRYVLIVAIVGFGGGATNYFPQLFNVYPYGNYLVIFYIIFMTYAIVKHKLMDIRLVVARSAAYLLLLISLAAFYALSVLGLEALFFPGQIVNFDWNQGILRTVISVVMVFLFQPLKTWITRATDKIFFRNQYDQDELLSELSHTMGSTIVLIELLYKVGDIITKNLKASRVLFAIVKDDTRMYAVQATGYKQTPDVDPRDVLKFARDGMIHYDDLEDGTRTKRLLNEYQANLAIPLKTEGEVVGVMLLGEKSSGDMYSQQDLNILEIMGPELAIAIENDKAYEEISRFNTTLRQEVKRATYRLKQKNEQLTELDHAKDEFISMASHQLRTPLTAIKGYLSMLLEGDAGDIKVSQYDFINEAYSGANRMVGLINDLLNVSRMDTGRFFLEPKEVDIERVVAEEAKQLSNAAKAKGLYLKVEAKGKVPHIWADETKIRQVVMNFMDNAIYYTNSGGVTVQLKHDKNNFIYEVHDTGIGVPKAQRDHMFEKFFRADNARTARPDGTGLGIYLAKRVIEDHGGEIVFSSEEGKGSVFGFKFPLKKKAGTKLASAPVPKSVGGSSIPTATDVAAKAE